MTDRPRDSAAAPRRSAVSSAATTLIATLEVVSAGIGRLPGIFVPVGSFGPLGFPGLFGYADAFLVALALFDLATLKRIHPATLWGGLFLVASQIGRYAFSTTVAWASFAAWLAS